MQARRIVRLLFIVTSLGLLLPSPVLSTSLGTRTITSGSLHIFGSLINTMNFQGDGVTVDAVLSLTTGGQFEPFLACGTGVACLPGATIPVDARNFSGLAVRGGGTLDGVPFTFGAFGNEATASINFTGTAVLPPLNTQGKTIIETSFDFAGSLFLPDHTMINLVGTGLATVSFTLVGSAWTYILNQDSARYDFSQPIPEPSTLLLLGSGLAGLGGAAWRRRRQK